MSSEEGGKARLHAPVYRDAQHVIAVCENAVVTYSIDAPNARYLEAWTDTMQLVAGQFADGLLAITLISPRARAPDDASRAHIRDTMLRNAARIRAFAYVVEGEGFGAAAIRGALSLIHLTARYPFPLKVFGRVDDAVPWVLSRTEPRTPRAQIAAQLVSVASSLGGQLRSVAAAS